MRTRYMLSTFLSFIVFICSIFPSLAIAATANVGGTLKIYLPVSIVSVSQIRFPTQFEGTLTSDLTDLSNISFPVPGGDPANVGQVDISGSQGTSYQFILPTTMTLTHSLGSANIVAAITGAASTNGPWTFNTGTYALPGANYGQYTSQTVWLKGVIASGTYIHMGLYTGSITITVLF
ncbi:MAG: hypothetical protein WCQ47_01445 [bacterium]